jgi:hypothetical protein
MSFGSISLPTSLTPRGANMGLTRKFMSVSTLGAVDMRSDKERIARKSAKGARYAKQSAKELKAQTRVMEAQAAAMHRAAQAQERAAMQTPSIPAASRPSPVAPALPRPQPPVPIPADWHPDPTGRFESRYWDGHSWTANVSSGGLVSTDPV